MRPSGQAVSPSLWSASPPARKGEGCSTSTGPRAQAGAESSPARPSVKCTEGCDGSPAQSSLHWAWQPGSGGPERPRSLGVSCCAVALLVSSEERTSRCHQPRTFRTDSCSCCFPLAKSRLILCSPMDCSTPGSSVLHHLPEFAQTHVR